MLYGNAKRRQMARSLLPSTARRGAAEDLAGIRRAGRRQVAQHLHGLSGPAARVADRWDDAAFDGRRWPQRRIKEAVWDRRAHDKVGSFQRWAVAVTAHLDAPDRLDAMRRIVPSGLMGRHALSHVDFLDHFSGHLPPRYWSSHRPPGTAASGPDYEAELREVLAEGRLAELNRWMKRPQFADPGRELPFRTLAGEHDVKAFLDDCSHSAGECASGRYRRPAPRPWLDGLHCWCTEAAPSLRSSDRC
jgi:hypothetical protein